MIHIIRLISGMEVVGEIVDKGGDIISVKEPLQILYITRSSGTPAVSLQRYIPFSTQEVFEFSWSHIESICEPIEGLEAYYNNALALIKKHIDPSMVSDLTNNDKSDARGYDSYLAMLEKFMSKKPLN